MEPPRSRSRYEYFEFSDDVGSDGLDVSFGNVEDNPYEDDEGGAYNEPDDRAFNPLSKEGEQSQTYPPPGTDAAQGPSPGRSAVQSRFQIGVKAGMEGIDKEKVNQVIYEMSKAVSIICFMSRFIIRIPTSLKMSNNKLSKHKSGLTH